ncbi:hypothetical protein F4Z98_03350 [Candidatus Poribacteria bacterium]|nr:hypothetical protein [Candidatus Poribacteria bacterium]MYA99399.1 hypothetical protein [Candidatus Poribacteria bacterium]
MRRDMHGSLTAAERNPSLVSPTRRNYASKRRQLLPIDQRIKRLRNHFAGVEHFAGAEYPPPEAFDFDNRFHFQHAVLICVFQQKLTRTQTAELLGTTEREIKFAMDVIKQNAE